LKREELIRQIKAKQSMLCVGLDVDLDKIPQHLKNTSDPIFEFNRAIVDATAPFAVAYKPNIAFYEAHGLAGWQSLERTITYINERYPEIFTIADAKRGDIGNTSRMYAEAFLNKLNFDSITVAPYMGSDSVQPFLDVPDKFTIVLGLTSNGGAKDFQFFENEKGDKLFEEVLRKVSSWGTPNNLMFVVGATKATELKRIRQIVPDHFLLVPGVGAQGGSLEEVLENGLNADGGLLINSSRAIIYASSGVDFAEKAAEESRKMVEVMKRYI